MMMNDDAGWIMMMDHDAEWWMCLMMVVLTDYAGDDDNG